jgi:hypothetical protein
VLILERTLDQVLGALQRVRSPCLFDHLLEPEVASAVAVVVVHRAPTGGALDSALALLHQHAGTLAWAWLPTAPPAL